MSYKYEDQLPNLLTPQGIMKILDTLLLARKLAKKSGAVTAGSILGVGDSWQSLAAIEFLSRNNYLRVVWDEGSAQKMILVVVRGGE